MYDKSLAGKEVEVVLNDKKGNKYSGLVYLLRNKNMIYYKASAKCRSVM